MRIPRFQFTLRAIMIAVAVVAIWLFIIVQSIIYRYLSTQSAWDIYN
jgi:hypothetical protein